MNRITIYAEDFDTDVWEDYCRITRVPFSATSISITFGEALIEYTETEEQLPESDETHRPGGLDSDAEIDNYVRSYLEEEYGHEVKSFSVEFDMRKIYISNIIWKE